MRRLGSVSHAPDWMSAQMTAASSASSALRSSCLNSSIVLTLSSPPRARAPCPGGPGSARPEEDGPAPSPSSASANAPSPRDSSAFPPPPCDGRGARRRCVRRPPGGHRAGGRGAVEGGGLRGAPGRSGPGPAAESSGDAFAPPPGGPVQRLPEAGRSGDATHLAGGHAGHEGHAGGGEALGVELAAREGGPEPRPGRTGQRGKLQRPPQLRPPRAWVGHRSPHPGRRVFGEEVGRGQECTFIGTRIAGRGAASRAWKKSFPRLS